ncbi:hypothetical protein AGMMS50289_02230 [Betaproteobacteria bacterium]|nr:hypothetical protein AGMMS50289_02230 [Betaproteobacteria bacterium]
MKNFFAKLWAFRQSDLYKNLLLALVFSGVGVVFLGLARPGFAMPLFPSIGIALAALILFGMRLWWGILLGAALLESVVIWTLGAPSGWWSLLCIAPIQLFQAWVGYWLTRRLTDFQVRHMLRFTLLIVPVCCFCGVLPAMWALNLSGIIPTDEIWFSALAWWLGDVLGILLVAPVMFVFFGKPRDYWQPLRVSVGLPIFVTFSLLVIAFMYVLGEERGRIQARFERDSQQMATILIRNLANKEEMLFAMEDLLRTRPDLSERTWQSILQSWMARHPGSENFAWIPYVRHDERAAFEDKMRRAGYANFTIRDANGRPAPPAEYYLPLTYLTPSRHQPENEHGRRGQDVSDQVRGWLARQEGVPLGAEVVAPIYVQEKDAKITLYHPVSATDSQQKWLGLVAESVNAHTLLVSILPDERMGLEACIVEIIGDTLNHVTGAEGCEKPEWQRQHFFLSHSVPLADRKGVLYTRTPDVLRLNQWGWNVWISLVACTLMVGLLAIFWLTHLNRLRLGQVQTSRRLAQLDTFSKRLRQQTEMLLLPQRFFQMGSWEMRADGFFLASHELCALLGFASGELETWAQLLTRIEPEDREKLQKALDNARATSGSASLDCRVLPTDAKAQTNRVFSFVISHIADADADVDADAKAAAPDTQGALRQQRLLGIVQEVTARRALVMDAPDKQPEQGLLLADSQLENALRQGMERDELRLHYQPMISSSDGRVVGCEALVRWMHPEMGLLLPERFISTAEESGLILALDEWSFATACRQQVAWSARKLTVTVNISARHFCRDDFLEILTRTLEQIGADPRYLELEITSNVLMLPGETLLERCHFLRGLGFGLALDNFGFGYSSMAYVRRLHISRLKLDRSFVNGLPDDADSCAVTKAALAMAPELGMEVSAKGVETTAQLKFLKEQGCPTLQGFLFGKAMDAAQFEHWLGKRSGGGGGGGGGGGRGGGGGGGRGFKVGGIRGGAGDL